MNLSSILAGIPEGLRTPLIKEYNNILQKYLERRWTPSELSGGKFCEIVYTILKGYSSGNYDYAPSKPSNFVHACRQLENDTGLPRSFRILIPRLLPAIYEIRNNRSVGHVGGDVDPNQMDSQAVVQTAGWIMGELIRVYHSVSIDEAQRIVDIVTERKLPLVWELDNIKRVLDPSFSFPDQILILLSTENNYVSVNDLFEWLDYSNKTYFKKMLKQLHKKRLVNLSKDELEVILLPTGYVEVEKLIRKKN